MNAIENDLRLMRVKIMARVGIYCALLLSAFLFIALRIDSAYGSGLIIFFLLILLFFIIPAYRKRLELGRRFCHDIMKSTIPLLHALPKELESNNHGEIQFNIFSFDSKFRLMINTTVDSAEQGESELSDISNKLSELLGEYDSNKNPSVYVNFDSLMVGLVALLLLGRCVDGRRVSLKLSVKGYHESFSFVGDKRSDVVRSIKHSIIYQSL